MVSSRSRARVCCATESLPYSGTLTTGMPSLAEASRSTTLKPVARTQTSLRRGSPESVSAQSLVLLVSRISAWEERSRIISLGVRS